MSTNDAPSRPTFMVMDDTLRSYGHRHELRWLDWEVVECSNRNAIGCGPAEKHILDGIELCVLRGDHDDPKHYPAMSIRASDDAFFHVGIAVWGDLTQGIVYCRYTDDLMLKADGDHVNLKYIKLPGKHMIPHHEAIMIGEKLAFRNMGCVKNSIWFVAITASDSSTGDTMVDVWTLDLTQRQVPEEWAMHINFTMQSICELDAFTQNRLPKTLPRFPILRQEDPGILYMLLPNPDGTKGQGPLCWH